MQSDESSVSPKISGQKDNTDDASTEQEKNRKLAESQESQVREQTERVKDREERPIPESDGATEAEVSSKLGRTAGDSDATG